MYYYNLFTCSFLFFGDPDLNIWLEDKFIFSSVFSLSLDLSFEADLADPFFLLFSLDPLDDLPFGAYYNYFIYYIILKINRRY